MKKKFYFLFLFLVVLSSIFVLKVNAFDMISISSASCSSSANTFTVNVSIDASSHADFDFEYFINLKQVVTNYSVNYSSVSVSCTMFNMETEDDFDFDGDYTYNFRSEGVVIFFYQPDSAIRYNFTITYQVPSNLGRSGNILNLVSLTEYVEIVDEGKTSAFVTTASVTLSNETHRGSLSGSIDFGNNNYEAGWYALDVNYIKEYYGFSSNVTGASFSCASNNLLNNAITESFTIDQNGNVIYFPLPDIQAGSAVVNYSVVFGGEASGEIDNRAGEKVLFYQITSNVSSDALAFSNEEYSYVVSVDNPITIDGLMALTSLRATDDYYGNSAITYDDNDGYFMNVNDVNETKERSLGNYSVTFRTSDSRSNQASLNVVLQVRDLVSPFIDEIESTLEYTKSYKDARISDEVLVAGIVAEDNYAQTNNLTVTVNSSSYATNYSTVNDYEIPVTVSDPSGNTTNGIILLRVIDDVAPVISGATSFHTSYTSAITAQEIIEKCVITAYDELDGNLNVVIENDTYTTNKFTPGEYQIRVSARDNAGNKSYLTINVIVTDNITPYFLINKTTLVVENGYAYTPAQILEAAMSSGLIRTGYKEIEVIEDDYTENYNQEGTYLYRLKVTYDNNEEYVDVKMKVLAKEPEIIKIKWYTKVGNFFVRSFTRVGHFFSDIVYEKGIKKVFNFVKNIWNRIFR